MLLYETMFSLDNSFKRLLQNEKLIQADIFKENKKKKLQFVIFSILINYTYWIYIYLFTFISMKSFYRSFLNFFKIKSVKFCDCFKDNLNENNYAWVPVFTWYLILDLYLLPLIRLLLQRNVATNFNMIKKCRIIQFKNTAQSVTDHPPQCFMAACRNTAAESDKSITVYGGLNHRMRIDFRWNMIPVNIPWPQSEFAGSTRFTMRVAIVTPPSIA